MSDELEAPLRWLALKDETRTGWQLRGVEEPESVAAHTWGVALLTLHYGPRAGIDVDRAIRMALVHDLAEAETGDVATRADPNVDSIDPAEKERRERAAMETVLESVDDGGELRARWEEYEARETPEARFVKDMDLIDMCLQAVRYERAGRYEPGECDAFEAYDRLDEFFATAEPRIRTDVGRELFTETRERYESAKRDRDRGR